MRVVTANLIGRALDYAVTHAMNPTLSEFEYLAPYSTDEDLANALIDTYHIRVRQREHDWVAIMCGTVECGPTREIAVAQSFAVHNLGEFTEIPDELLIEY